MAAAKALITYFGHSTVGIRTESSKQVIIDPFLDGNPRCPDALKSPTELDLICITHGHSDHSGSALRLAKEFGATVCATFELASLLAADGVPPANIEYMNKGGKIETIGLSIVLTQAFHSSSYQTVDGSTHYAGEAAGIVLELESGRRIYHAGDTLLFDDMKLIATRYKPEVAFLPIGDRYTMGPEDAAAAVRLLQPKVVIPIHWGTFEGLSGTPEEFEEHLEGSGSRVVVLQPGETFEF